MAMPESMPTYYDVLQVERNASPEKVRAAYRRMAQKYHPDKMPGNANAARAMAAINAAYEVLSDAQRRTEHDLWIRRAERGRPPPPPAAAPVTLWAFLHPATQWAWYLLVGTFLLALGTVFAALYLTAKPARAAVPAAEPPCRLAAPTPAPGCPPR